MERDYFMTAEEAKEYGIIDVVQTPARRRGRRGRLGPRQTRRNGATR